MTKQEMIDALLEIHHEGGFSIQEMITQLIVLTKDYRDVNPSSHLVKAIDALEAAKAYVDLADGEF